TVPLVRATGGLSDTVIDIRTDAQVGTGFCFTPYDSSALLETVDAALSYYQDKDTWHSLVRHGMAENFDWAKSAKRYQEVYLYVLELPPVSHRN
ncbi:MAG: hypothetical protein K2X66_01690, partial [Cyanobacteria bacterium]|nr:hypothetical protein [Cyanobacteriota bacterium]